MRLRSIFIQITVGLLIIALILFKLNIADVVSALKRTNPLYFILACLSYLCMNLVLSTRLKYLLTKIGYKIKFPTVFFSHMGGMIVGDITPGRSGYFLTPPLLKKNTGTSITDGMACIFAPQAIEFILKVAGAFVALFYIYTISDISDLLIPAGVGATFLLMIGIFMLMISWRDENLTSSLVRKLPVLKRFTEKISSFKESSILIKDNINAILVLYMVGWVFAGLQWFYLGRALGIEQPFFIFFLLHPLLSMLMFTLPSGIGLMDIGTILVFSLLGISPALAWAFSILVRISILLVDSIGLRTVLASVRDLEL